VGAWVEGGWERDEREAKKFTPNTKKKKNGGGGTRGSRQQLVILPQKKLWLVESKVKEGADSFII